MVSEHQSLLAVNIFTFFYDEYVELLMELTLRLPKRKNLEEASLTIMVIWTYNANIYVWTSLEYYGLLWQHLCVCITCFINNRSHLCGLIGQTRRVGRNNVHFICVLTVYCTPKPAQHRSLSNDDVFTTIQNMGRLSPQLYKLKTATCVLTANNYAKRCVKRKAPHLKIFKCLKK